MTKVLSLTLILLLISACNTTSQRTTPVKVAGDLPYNPKNKEEFIFWESSNSLKEYGYRDICFELPTRSILSECMYDKLPYKKYFGMKGYITGESEFKDYSGSIAQEARLENGEVIYLITTARSGRTPMRGILPISEYERLTSFKSEPLIKGSDVLITGYNKNRNKTLDVSSQNTHSFTTQEISSIRKIAKTYPFNSVEIAEGLSTLQVTYDDFENRTIVKGVYSTNPDSFLSIQLIFDANGVATPYIISKYTARKWLFVDRYSISADNYRWNSPELEFSRDNSGGDIWEWNIQALTEMHIKMLSKLANATNSTIRFYGKSYYADHTLTETQKTELKNLLNLASLTQ